MARRKIQREKPKHFCKECGLSYDWHSEALDGHLILCRCPHYEGGKWCKFLNDHSCGHFTPRKGGANA